MKPIIGTLKEQVAYVEFNRPERYNALSSELLREFIRLLQELSRDKSLKALVLRGKGKGFSSGVDLDELLTFSSVEEARDFALLLEEASEAVFRFPRPVVAVIHGLALGGAVGFAAAADIRVVEKDAILGFPAVKLGAILPATCTVYVESLIGRGRTAELTMTGRIFDGTEAYRMGLADYVTALENLDEQTAEILQRLREATPLALEMTKKTVNFPAAGLLEQAKLNAADNFAFLSATEEWQKRMRNFRQKREK